MQNLNVEILERVSSITDLVRDSNNFPIEHLVELAEICVQALTDGYKIAFVGNGGSAAEAIHLAAEFTGKCVVEHKPLSAICLNESQSSLTAIGNDFGFEFIFARQVAAHMKRGDILIALSTSGKSLNILNALDEANNIGVATYLWTGITELELKGTEIWQVGSKTTPRIQEMHLMWGHILAEVVEKYFAEKN